MRHYATTNTFLRHQTSSISLVIIFFAGLKPAVDARAADFVAQATTTTPEFLVRWLKCRRLLGVAGVASPFENNGGASMQTYSPQR